MSDLASRRVPFDSSNLDVSSTPKTVVLSLNFHHVNQYVLYGAFAKDGRGESELTIAAC